MGWGYRILKYLYSYLTNRKQRVRVGSSFSDWFAIILGVPQGSILGPILFNIFINDLLSLNLESEICNFADDNTLYACDNSIDSVVSKMNLDVSRVLNWFRSNEMVVNPDKFQVIFLGIKDSMNLLIDNNNIPITDTVKLLGVIIDKKLTFVLHITDICRRANNKVKALLRIRKYLDLPKVELLCNSFIISCFNYCPLIWMFCNKSAYKMITSTHRRALTAVQMDFSKSYDELLVQSKAEPVHLKNLRLLMIEVYKSVNRLNPEYMWELFVDKDFSYSLRLGTSLTLPSSKIASTNDLVFRACLAWNKLPKALKHSSSLEEFKSGINGISSIYCNCKLCAS